jgi:PIN domain.
MIATFDSSVWIEYFAGSEKGKSLKDIVDSTEIIYTPAICLLEIKAKYMKEKHEYRSRIEFICSRSDIIDVDSEVALKGAEMKIEHELYTVDALVYAAARYKNSILFTADHHFERLDKVELI